MAAEPANITLPADDSRHPGKENLPEWWYYNGHLAGKSGRKVGFELAFFQFSLWGIPMRAVQFALTDIGHQKFQYRTWLFPGEYAAVKNGFSLSIPGGPDATGGNGQDHLHARLPEGITLDLNLASQKKAIPEMGDGIISAVDPKSGAEIGHQHYYSRTRIAAQGTLTMDGVSEPVGGQSWFDHEWGKIGRVGWSWYSIQLDNSQEIMAYDMFETPGAPTSFKGANVIGSCSDCLDLVLGADDFSMPFSGAWKSPHSEITYPNAFSLEVPVMNMKLALTPLIQDAEIKSPLLQTYWEGPVSVSGTERGHPVTGQGYVELTGF